MLTKSLKTNGFEHPIAFGIEIASTYSGLLEKDSKLRIIAGGKPETILMPTLKGCLFYRDPKNTTLGSTSLGHCDLFGQAICEGDIQFCENSEALRKELSKQHKKGVRMDREPEEQHKKGSHYRVLVVDDDELLRKIVVAFLSRYGHQCETANNGIEALKKIRESKFDAVITDIVMPEMDGISLTKELLSLRPGLPVMIMTGHSNEYPTESAILAGARDFIEKPFSIEGFTLRFNKMMGDHEIFLRIDAKQREMLFHIQRESSEKINELQREVESLKSRLCDGFPHFDR